MEQVFQGFEGVSESRGGGRRSGAPIRRHSRLAGREGVFWRPFNRQEVGKLMLVAERYERAGRQHGSRVGPLGTIALEVLRELTRLIDYRTGRLDPAIDTLRARLKRSRKAVVRALKNLREHGFLDWIRRYVPAEGKGEGKGPQVQQTSSAYRLSLPAKALRLLGRLAEAPPIPDDDASRRETAETEFQTQVSALPLDEQVFALNGEGRLSEALARLGRSISGRNLT